MDASLARALIEIITKRELFSNFDKLDPGSAGDTDV